MSARGMEPSADLRARVLAAVRAEPAPTRRELAARGARASALFGALAVVAFLATGGAKSGGRPFAVVMLTSTLAAVVAVVLTRAATRNVNESGRVTMLGPTRRRLVAVVASVFGALTSVAIAAVLVWPDLAAADRADPRTDASCAALLVVQGIFPLLALVWPRRGGDPRNPALAGAALGAAAGAWAAMLAWLRCPHLVLGHGVVAHALPAVLLAALGAVIGARALRMR